MGLQISGPTLTCKGAIGMMKNMRKMTGSVVLAAALLAGGWRWRRMPKPSGTVSDRRNATAFILGGSVGGVC